MRRTRFIRAATQLVLLVMLVLAVQGCAGRAWKPRYAPQPGSADRLALETDVALSAKLPLIGGPEAHLALRIETTRRVAEGRSGGPTTVNLTVDRIAFEFDLSGDATRYDSAAPAADDNPAVRRYAAALLGRTLVVDVSSTGEVQAVRGLDGLYDELERISGEGSAIAGVLDAMTRDLGAAALGATLQQATPVFPGGRLRLGDTWTRESVLEHPLFESLRSASEYRLEEEGVFAGRRAARTTVSLTLVPEGQGPLLDQLRRLAGIEGEVRLEDGTADGTASIWSDRRTGQTLGLTMEQSVRATLSVPVSVLGFTRRARLPLKVDQRISLSRIDPD